MTDSFRKELQKFDAERVLPAWDGLIKKQQTTLETLGVPAMFPTTVSTDREVGVLCIRGRAWTYTEIQRQQRIMQVLANFAE